VRSARKRLMCQTQWPAHCCLPVFVDAALLEYQFTLEVPSDLRPSPGAA